MGHESITTTARIYAHLYDDELDQVAAALDGLRVRVDGLGEQPMCPKCAHEGRSGHEESPGRVGRCGVDLGLCLEPPVGIEPTTYSLRVNRSTD